MLYVHRWNTSYIGISLKNFKSARYLDSANINDNTHLSANFGHRMLRISFIMMVLQSLAPVY